MISNVGIFFVFDDQLPINAVTVKDGEPYGNTIGHSSHYDFWENLKPKTNIEKKFKTRAYEAYPHGRIGYFTPKEALCPLCRQIPEP